MSQPDYSPALSADLLQAIAQAFEQLPDTPLRFAVALSSGVDSAMLAAHAATFARQRGLQMCCFHVHHGLQGSADDWQRSAHALARLLRVACLSERVTVKTSAGKGLEAAARQARYQAFTRMADLAAVNCILLAHHQDDQAETVLLRLLRGAGPTGLAAMAPVARRQGLVYVRPWLNQSRSMLERCAQTFTDITGWQAVNDPSNTDDHYTRSALRVRISPQLNQRWPGWQANLARHARQSHDLTLLLDEVASNDFLALCPTTDNQGFSLQAWRALSPQRQALVLRYWLGKQGLPMPSDARLADWMRQLRSLHQGGTDRNMCVLHAGHIITCRKGRIQLEFGPSENENPQSR
jgi:tRNA(Ile)-lysidine synthase